MAIVLDIPMPVVDIKPFGLAVTVARNSPLPDRVAD